MSQSSALKDSSMPKRKVVTTHPSWVRSIPERCATEKEATREGKMCPDSRFDTHLSEKGPWIGQSNMGYPFLVPHAWIVQATIVNLFSTSTDCLIGSGLEVQKARSIL